MSSENWRRHLFLPRWSNARGALLLQKQCSLVVYALPLCSLGESNCEIREFYVHDLLALCQILQKIQTGSKQQQTRANQPVIYVCFFALLFFALDTPSFMHLHCLISAVFSAHWLALRKLPGIKTGKPEHGHYIQHNHYEQTQLCSCFASFQCLPERLAACFASGLLNGSVQTD